MVAGAGWPFGGLNTVGGVREGEGVGVMEGGDRGGEAPRTGDGEWVDWGREGGEWVGGGGEGRYGVEGGVVESMMGGGWWGGGGTGGRGRGGLARERRGGGSRSGVGGGGEVVGVGGAQRGEVGGKGGERTAVGWRRAIGGRGRLKIGKGPAGSRCRGRCDGARPGLLLGRDQRAAAVCVRRLASGRR